MNANDILALPPGPALDQAVHQFIFGGVGPTVPYSTDDREAAKIFDRMALFVGRVDSGPKYNAGRPWIAGVLAHEPSVNGYVTRLSVTAPSRLIALCKAALLVMFQPAKSDRGASPAAPRASSSEQAAKELAARIGTPGARNPAAGIRAAKEAADKRAADRIKRDEKAAKKAAKLAGVPYVSNPRKAQREEPPERPARVAPAHVQQPAVFTGERGRRTPMPRRPKEFIAPQPIDTGGNESK
jgi:hypothetical protein